MICYFHGGGWVLGSHDSDDAFCRDLCVRSDAIVVALDVVEATTIGTGAELNVRLTMRPPAGGAE